MKKNTDGTLYRIQIDIQYKDAYNIWEYEYDTDYAYQYKITFSEPCNFKAELDFENNFEYHEQELEVLPKYERI